MVIARMVMERLDALEKLINAATGSEPLGLDETVEALRVLDPNRYELDEELAELGVLEQLAGEDQT